MAQKDIPRGKLKLEPEHIFEGDALRATHFAGQRDVLIVVFDYRREGRAGFADAAHSTGFARQGYGQLSIRTAQNDWYINAETEALEAALAQVAARYRRVQMLGYSMGGYGALRFAKALNAQKAVIVSPQSSLLAPFEGRYLAESQGFDPLRGDLSARVQEGLEGLVVYDPFVREDLAHARAISALYPKMQHLRLPFGGHPAIRSLRASNGVWWMQREAALEKTSGREIQAAHRAARQSSAGYWQRLSAHALAKHPRLAESASQRGAELSPVAGDVD